jgi:hypothetical protein
MLLNFSAMNHAIKWTDTICLSRSHSLEPKIAGSLPTEAVGFFINGEKSTARNRIGREWTIEHKAHKTNK